MQPEDEPWSKEIFDVLGVVGKVGASRLKFEYGNRYKCYIGIVLTYGVFLRSQGLVPGGKGYT
jgi:hypothetical protein